MNCTLSANNCWLTPVERLTHWWTGFKPKSSSQIVHASNHDEQNGAPERRGQANWKLRIPRRRPVTVDVRRLGRRWTARNSDPLLTIPSGFVVSIRNTGITRRCRGCRSQRIEPRNWNNSERSRCLISAMLIRVSCGFRLRVPREARSAEFPVRAVGGGDASALGLRGDRRGAGIV
jgi:hypothetical protein